MKNERRQTEAHPVTTVEPTPEASPTVGRQSTSPLQPNQSDPKHGGAVGREAAAGVAKGVGISAGKRAWGTIEGWLGVIEEQ
ncbi:hypothetical protein [Streptomyces sp. NPDC056663]|uniref:hypothetical protein n=1 Tax=Streptomyces sp. NPDC056663 TaxID=3345899 RepID=UPI0036966451